MERETFKNLFDSYFEDVRQYIFYRSGNQELATDIAQETFMKLWEKNMNVDMDTVKGLLFKIANDLFLSNYRKEKVAFNFFNTFRPNARVITPLEELDYQELKTTYEKALQTMSEKQRVVFLMHRIEQRKYNEIAELLGLSVKTVEYRMSLALKHLKKYLNI